MPGNCIAEQNIKRRVNNEAYTMCKKQQQNTNWLQDPEHTGLLNDKTEHVNQRIHCWHEWKNLKRTTKNYFCLYDLYLDNLAYQAVPYEHQCYVRIKGCCSWSA